MKDNDSCVMDKVLASLWAKTNKNGEAGGHPLILHMLDVAAWDAILAREPKKRLTK